MTSRFIFFSFFFILSLPTYSAEAVSRSAVLGKVELENVDEWPVSDIYYRGPHLIYNCAQRHFVCVNETGRDECAELRAEARANRNTILPCAPLTKAKDIESCIKLHYELIHRKPDKGFCLGKY